ncbi:hypothetical protein [Acidovorax sp. Root219]|uniref:hypothetical protein n=1 Tax=Acidovorax sp. Root219 TaxID=1736493 RepID=UPI000B1F7EB3|nr:hypothetical protein [Acidovorax sp. Root219]
MTDPLVAAAFALGGALFTAVLGGLVAVLGVYLTQFVAENFRRFKDGSALAAALLGELRAYRQGFDAVRDAAKDWEQASLAKQKDSLGFRSIELTGMPVWEAAVGKVGLLGVGLVEDTVHVYSRLNGISISVDILHRHFKDMPDVEFQLRCRLTAESLEEVMARADLLMPKLQARAEARFLKGWTWIVKPWRWHGDR